MTRSTNSLLHNGEQFWDFFQTKKWDVKLYLDMFRLPPTFFLRSVIGTSLNFALRCPLEKRIPGMKSTGVFMKSDTPVCDMKISSGSTFVTKFVSQLFWLLAVVCGTKEGFYCFYQGFWEVLSDLSGLVRRVSYAPWKVQLIKDKSVTYQMMLLRKNSVIIWNMSR